MYYRKPLSCSADDFLTPEDEIYTFTPKKAMQAHRECYQSFRTALEEQVREIVIDNTNIKKSNYKQYQPAAEQCAIKLSLSKWRVNPKRAYLITNSEILMKYHTPFVN